MDTAVFSFDFLKDKVYTAGKLQGATNDMTETVIERFAEVAASLKNDSNWENRKRGAQLAAIAEWVKKFTPTASAESFGRHLDQILKNQGLGPAMTYQSEFSEIGIHYPGPYLKVEFRTNALEHRGLQQMLATCKHSKFEGCRFEIYDDKRHWILIDRKDVITSEFWFVRKSDYPTIDDLKSKFFDQFRK